MEKFDILNNVIKLIIMQRIICYLTKIEKMENHIIMNGQGENVDIIILCRRRERERERVQMVAHKIRAPSS